VNKRIFSLVILVWGIIYIAIGCEKSKPTSPTPNESPNVIIISPADGGKFKEGESIDFIGLATDPEDGVLPDSTLIWKSNLDGEIGIGKGFRKSNLSIGIHTIELIGKDSQNEEAVFLITIEIIEASPGEVVTFLPSPGDCPTGLTWSGRDLWIADECQGRLYKIDSHSAQVINFISSPGSEPSGLAWDGNCLWITDMAENKIYRMSLSDASIVNSFTAPGNSPVGLAWDGSYLWTADIENKRIYKLDSTDGLVLESFPSPGEYPSGITWDGQYLWTADVWYLKIYKLDPSNGSIITSFPVPGTWPRDLTWDGKYLWLADSAEKKIFKIKIPET
jgi:DNA-binding beta-propeller fold protein YncE